MKSDIAFQSTAHRSILLHRIAVASLFFIQGLGFASWASRIPTIQQKLHLSEAELGGVLFALPVGLMISLPFSGILIVKQGSKRVVLFSAVLYAVILLSIGLSFNTLHLIASLFLFGITGNMINIAVNTQAVGVEDLYKKSIMASFHGLWSLGGFTGAAIGAFMIGLGINPFYHFILILIITIAVVAVSSGYVLKKDINTKTDQPIFALPEKSLIKLGVIAFCSMICEGTMFDWSGIYFKNIVMAEKAWVGAGYTAFMSTMVMGRFIADRFTSRYGLKTTLQASGALTATGLIVSVLFPSLYTAILGFLLVGFGVSSVVPLVYSAAGKSQVLSPGVALAAVSTIGFLGFMIGPPLIGMVAAASSLKFSFTIIAVMGLSIALVATKAKV
ncbi:MFS transporter [Rubrolithibacter danxiaensis]|uniref:MFS transporter n=1 Tax=Rubrolithibacter danxiaensis TaxID=3390805 RepID=UPI003BF86B94